jgi:hypothetical protein
MLTLAQLHALPVFDPSRPIQAFWVEPHGGCWVSTGAVSGSNGGCIRAPRSSWTKRLPARLDELQRRRDDAEGKGA